MATGRTGEERVLTKGGCSENPAEVRGHRSCWSEVKPQEGCLQEPSSRKEDRKTSQVDAQERVCRTDTVEGREQGS